MSNNSIRYDKYERSNKRPAILSRKRKADNDIELPIELSSPCTSSTRTNSSCDNSPIAHQSEYSSSDENARYLLPATFSQFRGLANLRASSSPSFEDCPLPELDWAQQRDVWYSMVLKDKFYPKDHRVLQKHPELEPRMRSILLDWLVEVCEVYRLHRETFYLAQDYVDRFLFAKSNLPKNNLQLLGATALFVASKMEEIYPPKLEQFAFVTDGACTEQEILTQELILIMSLNWNLTPVTINSWLNTFMQLAYVENIENFIRPEKFPRNVFIQVSQVLDLCVLDIECLKFSYSVLAAAAIAHFLTKDTACTVSGLNWYDIAACVRWMDPFVAAVLENASSEVKYFSDVSSDDMHNIQTHNVGLKMLEKVRQKQERAIMERSPSNILRELTPPSSSKKPKQQNMEM